MGFLRSFKARIKFLRAKRAYYQQLNPIRNLSDPKAARLLAELQEKGFTVVENWLSPEEVHNLRSSLEADLISFRNDEHAISGPKWHFPQDGVYRILEADKRYPATNVFFESDLINTIAKAYVSDHVKSYQRMTEFRPEPGAACSSDGPHFDDWKIRFKAFLYLSDVSEKNAPFRYWPKSHIVKKIRSRMEYEYFRDGKKGSYGCYSQAQMDEIEKRYGLRCQTVFGKAGTLILADTRGIHAGTALQDPENPCITLANYFDLQ